MVHACVRGSAEPVVAAPLCLTSFLRLNSVAASGTATKGSTLQAAD